MAWLTLLQLNDLHAYLEPHPELFWEGGRPVTRVTGGLARIKAYFDQVHAECPGTVIALDNGDTFHGTGDRVELIQHELGEMHAARPLDLLLAQRVSGHLLPFRAAEEEIVGHTELLLHRGTTLNAPADDFLTAAVAHAAGTSIAFSNGWRYGAPIAPGPITRMAVWNLVPHDPPVSQVQLSGTELLQMLEDNLEAVFARTPWRQRGGYVKRMHGVVLYAKLENPLGTRVQAIEVTGEPLEPERQYQVAFLTNQAIPTRFGKNRRELPVSAVQAMLSYLKECGPVVAAPASVHLI